MTKQEMMEIVEGVDPRALGAAGFQLVLSELVSRLPDDPPKTKDPFDSMKGSGFNTDIPKMDDVMNAMSKVPDPMFDNSAVKEAEERLCKWVRTERESAFSSGIDIGMKVVWEKMKSRCNRGCHDDRCRPYLFEPITVPCAFERCPLLKDAK